MGYGRPARIHRSYPQGLAGCASTRGQSHCRPVDDCGHCRSVGDRWNRSKPWILYRRLAWLSPRGSISDPDRRRRRAERIAHLSRRDTSGPSQPVRSGVSHKIGPPPDSVVPRATSLCRAARTAWWRALRSVSGDSRPFVHIEAHGAALTVSPPSDRGSWGGRLRAGSVVCRVGCASGGSWGAASRGRIAAGLSERAVVERAGSHASSLVWLCGRGRTVSWMRSCRLRVRCAGLSGAGRPAVPGGRASDHARYGQARVTGTSGVELRGLDVLFRTAACCRHAGGRST